MGIISSLLTNKVTIKSIGILSAGMIAYDAYKVGKTKGVEATKVSIGEELTDTLVLHQITGGNSHVIDSIKKTYFEYLLDDQFMNSVKSFFIQAGSIAKEFFNSAVPLTLAAGAIFIKKSKIVSGACAALLAVGGLKILASDVMGIGKPKMIE